MHSPQSCIARLAVKIKIKLRARRLPLRFWRARYQAIAANTPRAPLQRASVIAHMASSSDAAPMASGGDAASTGVRGDLQRTAGVCLVIAGSFSSSIGLLLFKRSSLCEAQLPFHRKRFWHLGFLFLVVNATVIDLVAFSFTPLSLIAPFAGLTIVFTALLAASGLVTGARHKEALGWLDGIVIAVVVAGVTLVSLHGPTSAEGEPPTMDEMLVRFSNPPFVAFASVSTAVIFCFVGSQRIAPMRRSLNNCGTLKVFCNAFTAAGCGALSQARSTPGFPGAPRSRS